MATLNHYLATGLYCVGAAALKRIGHQREQYAATKQPGYSCCTKTLPEGGTSVKTTTPLWSNKDRQRERRRKMEHTDTVGIEIQMKKLVHIYS